jgi:hypothetical protein
MPLPAFHLVVLVTAGLLVGMQSVPPAQAQHPASVTTVLNSDQDTTLEVNHNGSLLMPGTPAPIAEDDSIPAEGAGTRLMWYPAKAALRAGQVGVNEDGTQWDAPKVGTHSVAFGVDTEASGNASMAVGSGTVASGARSLAIGFQSIADGSSGLVVGRGARVESRSSAAMGFQTRVMGDYSAAIGRSTTAATTSSLSIGLCNNANSGSSGDGTLFAAGNGTPVGSSGSCDRRSDALVLKENGDLAVGFSDPDARLHAQGDVRADPQGTPGAHVGLVENTNSDDGADVLALQAGEQAGNIEATTHFISFYGSQSSLMGAIRGNGAGGVELTGTGADFAEALPVAAAAETPDPADLVGVKSGAVRLETQDADRVMIASRSPIVTGHARSSTEADEARRVEVAFVGQVPATVRGPAQPGDLIVASGRADGTAQAVDPADYRRSEHGPIAGQAWSAKASDGVGEVTVAVGLGRSGAVAERLAKQQAQIDALKSRADQVDRLKRRLATLESRRFSALAGVSGSTTGLLLGLLLGGLFGIGLLWRRRS